jgi:hypothetical protein
MSPDKVESPSPMIDTGSKIDESPLALSENLKDKILYAILNEGKQKNLDAMIDTMQFWLTKQRGAAGRCARLGQALGMRLTRASFAVMIKFSGKTKDLLNMLDEFDFEVEELDIEKGPKRDAKLKEILEDLPSSKEILGHWLNAAKMRTWF